MLKKTSILIALSVFAAALLIVSCGGGSGSSDPGKAPEVEVITGGNTGGNTGGDTGGNTGGNTGGDTGGNTGGNTGGDTGGNTGGTTGGEVVVIKTVDGQLPINNEYLNPSVYNPETAGSSSTITVKDESGNGCSYTVDNTTGNITITPSDGSAAGTYTVTITADGREYILIIQVSADGEAVVNTAISYPAGSHMVLDLASGKVKTDTDGDGTLEDYLILSSLTGSVYGLDSLISSFTVQDSNGSVIEAAIDPVTGDIITGGSGSDSYTITIVKKDGTIVTIHTDSTGKIISIPVDGMSHVLITSSNGYAVIVPETTVSGVKIEAVIHIAEKASGVWSQLPSITGITASTGENYSQPIEVKIDPLTGSIVTPGLIFANTKVVINETTAEFTAIHTIFLKADGKISEYVKVQFLTDGTKIVTTVTFDADGNVSVYEEKVIKPNGETITTTVVVSTAVVTVSHVGVMLKLDGGSVSSDGFVLTLTDKPGGFWALKDGVQILSGMAANGSIIIDVSKITVDPVTGYLLINGDGTIVPSGPYEIKVSVNGKIYVIKTNEAGGIETILPGNIVLQISQGFITYSEMDVLKIAVKNGSIWSFSSQIGPITAVDSNMNTVSVSIDPATGNILTSDTYSGTVTLTFVYTDAKGNGITYTVVVINGSVYSYTAEITNPSTDFDFSTVTNIRVFLNVVDAKTGSPVKQASISLANVSAESSWKGFTDNDGRSVFTATVAAASQTTSITVTHSGYISVESPIDGIGKLIEIGKKIAMNPESVVVTPTDTDGDGVADTDDNYPTDPTGAKMITGTYTFGFEDQYSWDRVTFNQLDQNGVRSGNDADFNDLVVRLSIEEKIDSQNKIREIKLTAKTLTALSANDNSFGIYVKGEIKDNATNEFKIELQRKIMILNSKSLPETTCVIPFTNGVTRNEIGPMPYDPFMVPNGGNNGTDGLNEVHLASVNTTYTGVRKADGFVKTGSKWVIINRRSVDVGVYAEIKGFVWALIVPEDWQWPKEGTCIAIAYPGFVSWCNSDGELDIQWYNFPKTPIIDYVVPRQ